MKYTRYKIEENFGKFYILIPTWKFWWKRLGYWKTHSVGFNDHKSWYYYTFDTQKEASEFAWNHKYREGDVIG